MRASAELQSNAGVIPLLSKKSPVILAQAGIQRLSAKHLDSRLRGNDECNGGSRRFSR
jgi:hypothetical protein